MKEAAGLGEEMDYMKKKKMMQGLCATCAKKRANDKMAPLCKQCERKTKGA